jgi:hypothetical protein
MGGFTQVTRVPCFCFSSKTNAFKFPKRMLSGIRDEVKGKNVSASG